MWEYNDAHVLMHYGVLGMKWGQRRAQKLQSKINSGQYNDKSASYQRRINKIKNKEKNFGGAGKRVKNMRMPEVVGKTMLLGTYGTVKFEQNRAKGRSVVKSFLYSYGPVTLNNLTSGISSAVEARLKR